MSEMMQFEYVAAAIAVLLLALLYLAYRFLATSGWVMGWIQGNLGMGLLLLCGLLALAIMDIRSYQPMFDDRPIGTVSVHTLGPGSHQLRYVNNKGIEQSYLIAGDRYSINIRQFRWGVRYVGMGMGHGYRLDHVVAASADGAKKEQVPIASSDKIDVWRFYRNHLSSGFLFSAEEVETVPRTVVDGAMYELTPQAFDINLVPLNQVAKDAEAGTVSVAAPAEALLAPASPVDSAVPASGAVPAVQPTATSPPATAEKSPVAEAPVPESSVSQGKIIRTPPVKTEEMPGAHLQATPATVIEKPIVEKPADR